MRDLITYYFCILVPFALLILAGKTNTIGSGWFMLLFLLYVLYRQFTDAWRLRALGLIDKVTLKILLNFFIQLKYFNALYLGKRG